MVPHERWASSCCGLALAGLLAVVLGVACQASAPAQSPAAGAPAASASPAAVAPAPKPAAPSGAAAAPVELTTLRVTDYQITSSAGVYIASAKGYFRDEGIQIELVRATAQDMVPLLVSGQVDVASGAINASLYNAFARGMPAKIVADHGANLPNASAGGIVFRKDLVDSGAIQGPADLRGRKVAKSAAGSAADISLDYYLRGGGLSSADIDITLLNFPDIIPAFENRAIDAAYYQEAFTTIAVERGAAVRGPIGYDIYPNQQIGVILFGERMLGDRALGLRFLRAYVRGVRDYVRAMIERDPAAFDDVVPILIEATTVKERVLFEKAIPSGLKWDPITNLQSMVDDQEWYLANGLQTGRVNIPDFVDTSTVEQAIRELGPGR